MAFTEADRVQIRKYLGYSRQYAQIFTELEASIDQVQAVSDGGAFPDSGGVPSPTEVEVKSVVVDLQAIDAQLKTQWPLLAALTMDELKVDTVRGVAMLRSEGRRIVTHLSSILNIRPRRDVFSSSTASEYRTGMGPYDGGQQ